MHDFESAASAERQAVDVISLDRRPRRGEASLIVPATLAASFRGV
jgi:hypothetical protein